MKRVNKPKEDLEKQVIPGLEITIKELTAMGGVCERVGPDRVLIHAPRRLVSADSVARTDRMEAILDKLFPLIESEKTDPALRSLVMQLLDWVCDELSGRDESWRQVVSKLITNEIDAAKAPRRKGAEEKARKNPLARAQADARMEIRKEWEKWRTNLVRYENDEDFGRRLHLKYPQYKSDRSIANLSRRWGSEAAQC